MGIIPAGKESKKAEDVGQPVGADPKKEAKASVLLSRAEAIKALRAKGHEYNDLKTKKQAELNAML